MILMEINFIAVILWWRNWMNLQSFYGGRHLSCWDFTGRVVIVFSGEQGGSFLFRQSFDSGGTIDNANGQLDVNSFTLTAWFKPGNGWGMIQGFGASLFQMEWDQIIREIVNIGCTCIINNFWYYTFYPPNDLHISAHFKSLQRLCCYFLFNHSVHAPQNHLL